MAKIFYVDSCVWIDLVEDRNDYLRPLGEFAFHFFRGCVEHECKIICSEFVLSEITRILGKEKVGFIFEEYKEALVFVEPTKEQIIEAIRLSRKTLNAHYADIIHALLARDSGSILITRDKHFDELGEIVIVLKPEEAVFE